LAPKQPGPVEQPDSEPSAAPGCRIAPKRISRRERAQPVRSPVRSAAFAGAIQIPCRDL